MSVTPEVIARNLARVQERIAEACRRCGRNVEEVTLVAVTKTVGVDEIRALYEAGVRHVGENRVPVALEKHQHLASLDLRWHFIGHLQRNKAAQLLRGGFGIIHSVESSKLLAILGREASASAPVEIFLEVNVSGEEAKYGLAPEAVEEVLRETLALPGVRARGLMTMAPWESEAEATRPVFAGLRALRDTLAETTGAALPDLSMGMSNDYEIAIEEGATLVRVGSALFQEEEE